MEEHLFYMQMALQQAEQAYEKGEIPVGAVLVADRKVLAKTHNSTEQLKDVTAHAEMLAITAGSAYLGNKYLINCRLYITLEPCPMCTGALFWSKIAQVIYGASDPKHGACRHENLHPKTELISGILAQESTLLLKDFFADKR